MRPAEPLSRSGGARRPPAFRRGQFLFIAFAASLGVLAACAAPAAQRVLPESGEQIQLSFAPVVRIAAPAVVNIYSRRVVTTAGSPLFNDPFFRRFFGENFSFGAPRQRVQNSLGSGVIVSPDGTIVTNHHVVGGADEITVVLADKREFAAKLLGSDEHSDLAVLKVDTGGESLPYIEFRDSDTVQVGDLVLAIGNPFGVGQTVTSGIVSAQARTAVGISDLNFFIQTDAAINPGNSGGPLLNLAGELVGVNSAIRTSTGTNSGVGFSIPVNAVRRVIPALIAEGVYHYPFLGIRMTSLDLATQEELGLSQAAGAYITDITPDSPAARAGLVASGFNDTVGLIPGGDLIVAANGRPIAGPDDLISFLVFDAEVGQTITLTVIRDGQQIDVPLTLGERP